MKVVKWTRWLLCVCALYMLVSLGTTVYADEIGNEVDVLASSSNNISKINIELIQTTFIAEFEIPDFENNIQLLQVVLQDKSVLYIDPFSEKWEQYGLSLKLYDAISGEEIAITSHQMLEVGYYYYSVIGNNCSTEVHFSVDSVQNRALDVSFDYSIPLISVSQERLDD